MDPLLLIVIGAALAGFAQGVSGFAYSLVALSVWAWGVDPALAAPMSVFGALTGQLVTLPWVWRGFSLRLLLPLVAGGVLGIPIGVVLLQLFDPITFKFCLGIFLVLYCPLNLLSRPGNRMTFGGRFADGVAGFIGGIGGGIGGIAGPFPTLWTTLRGWDKDTQRGVLQGFNITLHTVTMVIYVGTGVVTIATVPSLGIVAASLILPAIAGVMLFRRMTQVQFRRVILVLLTASGVALIAGSMVAWAG